MMKLLKVAFCSMSFLLLANNSFAEDPLTLWYAAPAQDWNQALPLGNGRLGVMVFGGTEKEHLQLNEDTLWAGSPNNNVNPNIAPQIKKVRNLLLAGKYVEAQELANRFLNSTTNQGMPYQTLGDLWLEFPAHNPAKNYRRELSLDKATARVAYDIDDVHYEREIISSFTDQVIAVKFTASKPKSINFSLNYSSPIDYKTKVENNLLMINGKGSEHEGQEGKIKYYAVVKPIVQDGQITTQSDQLTIKNATSVILYISAATNFKNYHDLSINEVEKADAFLKAIQDKSFEQLKKAHQDYYQSQFNRVTLKLNADTEYTNFPTDKRIAEFAEHSKNHPDNQLVELYYQYGRYLLISSSQPGTQPANLQGIWNESAKGAWDSKYTVNINTEMNYWPAESTNLSELHQPLFSMIKDLSVTGQETAQKIYGASGWALHHNTDIWRISGQVDPTFWGQWPMGSAWLCQHIWYHYLYTGDTEFLRENYSILRDASAFYIDILTKHPKYGWLVVAPSISPENAYIQKPQVSITAGATMDNQLVFDLFSVVLDANKVLSKNNLVKADKEFIKKLTKMREQLAPMQIGQYGQLQEWLEDWDSPTDKHRHVSHLYGLFPSNQISATRTPELFQAAKKTLEQRGDESTGWSMAWKINFWARLLDGEHAYKLLTDQIKLVDSKVSWGGPGGTFPNMFDAHPPFQIDGNFGVTAGITEMLLQSQDGFVYLLPALPNQWKNGKVSGLKARGGFEISMEWADSKIIQLEVRSTLGGNLRLFTNSPLQLVGGDVKVAKGSNTNFFYQTPNQKKPLNHSKLPHEIVNSMVNAKAMLDVPTKPNETYRFIAKPKPEKIY